MNHRHLPQAREVPRSASNRACRKPGRDARQLGSRVVPGFGRGCSCRSARHLGLRGPVRAPATSSNSSPTRSRVDGPEGPSRRLHRPPRLVPRCTSPAPAGSASTRPPACSPPRDTSRSPAPPTPQTAAPIAGGVRVRQERSDDPGRRPRRGVQRSTWPWTRIDEAPRVTKPYAEDQWNADRPTSAERVDARPARVGRAADDGRRADVREHRATANRGGVEHGRARRPKKRLQGPCSS